MDRSVFARHFQAAAQIARDFARQFLEETLPDEMIFRAHLNSSYDKNPEPHVKLFPEDSSNERTLSTKQLDVEGVVALLWRDGFVPQWVDLSVAGVTNTATIVEVLSCGRFAEDEQNLYYAQTGIAPFSPKGPSLPVNHVDGARFSVYDRSSCWSRADLALVEQNAASRGQRSASMTSTGWYSRDTGLSHRKRRSRALVASWTTEKLSQTLDLSVMAISIPRPRRKLHR